jgi:hypothetical protein
MPWVFIWVYEGNLQLAFERKNSLNKKADYQFNQPLQYLLG